MASIRLNKSDKEIIAKQASKKSKAKKKHTAVVEELRQFAEVIRIHALGGEEKAKEYDAIAKKLVDIRMALPEELTSYGSVININNSLYVEVGNNRYTLYLPKSDSVAPRTRIILEEGSDIANKLIDIEDRERKLRNEVNQVENEVYASISSITTVNKLLKMWPEAEELIPSWLKQEPVQLPALQTKKLNNLIGLPSDKQTGENK